MTDHELRQRALETATMGHPLALARLREMQAVIEAAKPFLTIIPNFSTVQSLMEMVEDLRETLRAGGWIE